MKQIEGPQILIGNNLGKTNGWVEATAVVGRVIEVANPDEARDVPP